MGVVLALLVPWVSDCSCATLQVDSNTITAFVDEVMDLVELGSLRDAVVGVPGVSGLSVEQRKRLTIAVELVRSRALCCGCLQWH